MFIDPQDIKNPEHLSLFKKVSRNYIDKVKFVWVDGTKPDVIIKRKKLGLVSDKLPSVAFNLGSYDISPFPESKEITEERLDYFVKSFLDGKKYAPKEINVKNELVPECAHVNRDEFKDKVLVEGYDSIFLLYSSDNHKESKTVAPVFNRLCKRLRELEFPYLNAYAIDLGAGSVYRTVEISKVPAIYMVPAYNKSPPYIMYEGRNDALSLMLFVQKYAEIKFNLPDLPHLSPDEVEEYWKAKSKLREELQDTVSKENELKEYI
jgi:Thioredoxin-like domain